MKAFKPIETATNQDIQIKTREVYVVCGASKAYLSEKGALNKLAYVRAQKQFNAEDRPSNFPAQEVIQEDGTSALRRGKIRPEFMGRHAQVLEELKADVRREREKIALRKKYSKAINKINSLHETISELEIQIAELE
ncbi:hypothetical protein KKJ01_04220 [Xenorhabdus bovienii]|uniref:Uncharacterized protein n=1 Tax=Xenorhabdus bovienii TaxID=40576 RepID=A0AAJ1J7A1_XENBV|nr:hypothetical protein [Xenorhabdus bovienii]MDE1477466.1 hypothetical protein [Xenorhabdus bovienii]MDE9512231.1 hypothetical protein [Xenorhabdus bovienii]MDE9520853.1 hypothetical protein [Xenorhabdus bovienii]